MWGGRGGNRTLGELKMPMPVEDERGGEEEEEDGDVDEPRLPQKREDEEVAAEEGSTEAAPGGRVKDPAMLLEKRGTTRCVCPPH
ncbi:hypothetical protein NDU88_002093 [Pleurodeles waltl]|uniref:Uncharacterized protein n=1 Tax=Pleurodeles waltl TaxID=8319 RepID=A0AAV7VC36_PLEWA|nr:hypothetical protein NDU88_002093 [Pleurodeles waltl]